MAVYKISGVWKNNENVITHYAMHEKTEKGHRTAEKVIKADAISLLEQKGNSAMTWLWNYEEVGWRNGEEVEVITTRNGKYLRSNPDNELTDNLAHLIDYDWIR